MFWKIPSFISVFMVNSNRNQTTILVYQIKNSYCPLRESTNSTSKFEESYGGKTFLISHNRSLMKYRNSHPEMIRKISVLKNYAKFIWKHLSRILFPMTLCRSRPATITAKNTAISPNFLVWKFCGNAQFPHSFAWISEIYLENVRFQKISTPRNSGITIYYVVVHRLCAGIFLTDYQDRVNIDIFRNNLLQILNEKNKYGAKFG